MSWLFSQALVAEYSPVTFLDGTQCAPLSVMPTQHKFWRNDKTMDASDLSLFGLTCAVLTEDRGKELLMSFLADFPVRTLAPLAAELESMASAQVCGRKWQESSVRFDLTSFSWKTHQCLEPEVLPWSSVILPKWGIAVSGYVYQHRTQERPISVTATGLWPTPQASDNRDRGNLSTPAIQRRIAIGKQVNLSMCVSHKNGRLNPPWVEWLMGWPIGWTDLRPLEMDRFQEWQQQHSLC